MQFKAEVDDQGRTRVVRLAGRLERDQVDDLTTLVDEAPGAILLDLSDLLSADATGLAALEGLRRRGASLVGTSPYLALQLEIARTGRTQESHGSVTSTAHVTGHRTSTTNHREDE